MQVVETRRTYANREYVLVDTTEQDARAWAVAARQSGWHIESITRVRTRPGNWTVNLRRDR